MPLAGIAAHHHTHPFAGLTRRSLHLQKALKLFQQRCRFVAEFGRILPHLQGTEQDVAQKLRRIQSDFGCLVKEKRRRQHARSGVRVVQEHAAIGQQKSIQACIYLKTKSAVHFFAGKTDGIQFFFTHCDGGDFP